LTTLPLFSKRPATQIIYFSDMTLSASLSLRTLGNSDLKITPIGFGAWAIGGGDWQFSWGPQDDNDSIAAIHRALDLGVNWIDTAAIYGLGHSEEVVGRAVKSSTYKPYIFTKCSLRWHDDRSIYNSLKAGSVAEEVEASLGRLGVETIDLYQIHWPNPDGEIEEGWEALCAAAQAG
jgi:aryl-alcohol dehydrogenase-like predicted oxidoreductase